jgi:hypothetical protein
MDDVLRKIIEDRIAYWSREPRDEAMGATFRVMELRYILEILLPDRQPTGEAKEKP